jgi:hypothetical protein
MSEDEVNEYIDFRIPKKNSDDDDDNSLIQSEVMI